MATKVDSLPNDRQTAVDQLITSWKDRKRQHEQDSQALIHTSTYQAALEELEKRRAARGSQTVKV